MLGSGFLYDPISIIVFLASLSMAPFLAMMVSSFVKLVVVMNLIRQALGLQQVPPNMVINGLAIILTVYVMAPCIQQTVYRGIEIRDLFNQRKEQKDAFKMPSKFDSYFSNDQSMDTIPLLLNTTSSIGIERTKLEETKAMLSYAKEPISMFLFKNSSTKLRAFFVKMTKKLWPKEFSQTVKQNDILILIPAFTLSELVASFEIGFLIYLPFIVIDLVVSNILLAMGMMMVSPMTISLPFKLMLFVLIDGWSRLIESLLLTYN